MNSRYPLSLCKRTIDSSFCLWSQTVSFFRQDRWPSSPQSIGVHYRSSRHPSFSRRGWWTESRWDVLRSLSISWNLCLTWYRESIKRMELLDCSIRASRKRSIQPWKSSHSLTLFKLRMYSLRLSLKYPLRYNTGYSNTLLLLSISMIKSLPILPLPSVNGCIVSNW